MNRFFIISALVALLTFAPDAFTQTVKDIVVSSDSSFTDHIAAGRDRRDMDLMVKFIFDEENNKLKVSLLSYRSLFVFREDCRYKQVTSWFRRFRPERLPYVVAYNPAVKYRFSKQLKKSLKPSSCKYIFKHWIDVEGLQSVPAEYKIDNDFIEQVFDITPGGAVATVSIGDVFFMEGNNIVEGRNLNLQYNIKIKRNPCFGKDDEIATAQALLGGVKEAFANLRTSFADTLKSQAELAVFNQTVGLLKGVYPRKDTVVECSQLREIWDNYNNCVDSIGTMSVVVFQVSKPGIDAAYLLSNAMKIDKYVSRWTYSTDEVERRDLFRFCRKIVSETEAEIEAQGVVTPEQKNALTVYRAAKLYYEDTCK